MPRRRGGRPGPGRGPTPPHPAVAVDVVVWLEETPPRVLLVRRGHEPFAGCWALPGGFVGIDEGLEAAARRELEEETGLAVTTLHQVGAFGRPDRDPRERVVSIAYVARLPPPAPEVRGADDAVQARWFAVDALPDLAFDHAEILAAARAGRF